MKLKLLLLFFFVSCIGLNLYSQVKADTIRNLVISEVRLDNMQYAYIEVTNMSTSDAVDLSTVSMGNLTPWTLPWNSDAAHQVRLPKKILWPGESYVIVNIYDLPGKMKLIDPERWVGRQNTQLDMWELGDMQIHVAETDFGSFPAYDSVSPAGRMVFETWNGRDVYFLRQHFSDIDSVVIDQVNADFSRSGGYPPTSARTVAGVTNATANSILVRKFSIKNGDLFGDNWPQARGVDLTDSEWMPIPTPRNGWGKEGIKVKSFWTVGNHGNFRLTPTSFKSSSIDINWIDTALTIPWGSRREYNIMTYFDYSPGFAWIYNRSTNREDSAFVSARTGDKLRIYAAGNKLEMWDFKITVSEPTNDANIVVPKNSLNTNGTYGGNPYNVTWDVPGMDTIYDVGFATRGDTLMKYLEKAPAAAWEIVPVDGVVRPDLKDGDKLKVTAKNGAVKNYYIKIEKFIPSHTAFLSSITWPDIPPFYRGLFGWVGDTIPGFKPSVFQYSVEVPSDVPGYPAFAAKTQDLDASFEMIRPANIGGTAAQRTLVINTAAEDDTTLLTYKVVLSKEKAPTDVQPFTPEPFWSQRAHRQEWYGSAMEICNPGNQPLDLSNYMIVKGGNDGTPATAITNAKTRAFNARYNIYIPGRVWSNEAAWLVEPYRAIQDLAVNPVVMGGDVFVAAALGTSRYYGLCDKPDVDFWSNPWGDTLITAGDGGTGGNPVRGWHTDTYYLFKIINDSVSAGTKAVGDPLDFELIDCFGNGDGTGWIIGGFQIDQTMRIERRPQYWKPTPGYKESFGTTTRVTPARYPPKDDGQWEVQDRSWFGKNGYGWPTDVRMPVSGLGSHTFDPITEYMSTVSSTTYKVSAGYSMNETIKGVITGTTVDQFLAGINKDDVGQTLTLKRGTTVLAGTATVSSADFLQVVSKDTKNTTKYILTVAATGLSNNALLTSTKYTVAVSGSTGTVTGYPYGTTLKTVVDGVVAPAGARFSVIDAAGAYVPLIMLNYDTAYVSVLVNDKTFFEVIAEDNKTIIRYQLKPTALATDAFVLSNVYMVDQAKTFIQFIPRNTAVPAFLANLIPAAGATIKLIDKSGLERTWGNIYQDDKVVVTAADGKTQKVYFLAMLLTREALGEVVNYQAYVLSTVYAVDQVALKISGGLTGAQLRVPFLANLTPATGATAVVVNAAGIVSTKADLDQGDKVKVTAANGTTIVYYTIEFATAVNELTNANIQLYPNPTTGVVNISGIESGNRIRVFNAMGVNISSVIASSNQAVISLDNQPSGMYLIMVENADQLIGRFKVVRK